MKIIQKYNSIYVYLENDKDLHRFENFAERERKGLDYCPGDKKRWQEVKKQELVILRFNRINKLSSYDKEPHWAMVPETPLSDQGLGILIHSPQHIEIYYRLGADQMLWSKFYCRLEDALLNKITFFAFVFMKKFVSRLMSHNGLNVYIKTTPNEILELSNAKIFDKRNWEWQWHSQTAKTIVFRLRENNWKNLHEKIESYYIKKSKPIDCL